MFFRQIFDEKLAQYAYLVGCQKTGEALIIDPQRDVDRYLEAASHEGLRLVACAETHIHADFLSGCRELAHTHGTRVYLSAMGDEDWQYEWTHEGGYDYHLLNDGDTFRVGNIEVRAIHTPGHTPEHLSYLITDLGGGADVPMGLASGDFVFVGDVGRPDLLESAAGQAGAMEPAARRLYDSVQHFLELPPYLQLWPGHGAGSACGKALGAVPASTVGYEHRFNAAIQSAREGEDTFVRDILEGQPEPPLYFARMKRQNKQGPRVLGALPTPSRLDAEALADLAGRADVAVVDTRLDRSAFMRSHLQGALYAPLNKTFNTVVGSYVDEGTPLYLIIDANRVEEAVRDLVRIGLDDVVGFATPDALEALPGDLMATTEEIDFDDVASRRGRDDVLVLDVRRKTEYDEAHVPGAYNIAHTRLADRMDELPRDRQLLVHCKSGARAAVASALLERNGFEVGYINDLFADWEAQHEVSRGEAEETPA